MPTHDEELARAFDRQAEAFERAKVQRDAASLARLVAAAALPQGARVLDAGCGPGLVAEAFLEAGCAVTGVDLSPEMLRRARQRCARFGERARFELCSLYDLPAGEPFDATVSRNVLHHVEDPAAFVTRQARLVRPGGVVLAQDLVTDPDVARRAWAEGIERDRDRTHTQALTPGELLDLLAAAGLVAASLEEEALVLDFDEWFDRGSPGAPKPAVRARLLAGRARGFEPRARADGGVDIDVTRALARAVRPPVR
jgi:SAM-dependent methyltransferase